MALSSVSPAWAQSPTPASSTPTPSAAASSAPSVEQAVSPEKAAEQAFDEGVQAYHRGDYATAREAFARAYDLDRSYRTAAVLGQTEEKLGHLAQAATLLNWALFHLDANVEANTKARIHADLKLVQGRVLTLKLKTRVPFHEVLIDDLLFSSNSIRVLPEGDNTWTVYLEPQVHQVRVRADGFPEQGRQVEGPAGAALDWELRWGAEPPQQALPQRPHSAEAAQAPASSSAPQATSTRVEAQRPLAWQLPTAIATGGLGLVAAGFGFYSLHQYGVADDNVDKTRRALQGTNLTAPCGTGGPSSVQPACNSLVAGMDDRVTHGNRAIVTLSTAGGLALASTALWVWWWNERAGTDQAAWTVAPVGGDSEWGATLRGSF